MTNPRFLYSAVYGFTNYDVIDFFENLGVRTKMERGGRMFPQSDHSSDIILSMERKMKELGVRVHLQTRVSRLLIDEEAAQICGAELENGVKISADMVLVATGGISYPSTGATGDGYRMAKDAGHTVYYHFPG